MLLSLVHDTPGRRHPPLPGAGFCVTPVGGTWPRTRGLKKTHKQNAKWLAVDVCAWRSAQLDFSAVADAGVKSAWWFAPREGAAVSQPRRWPLLLAPGMWARRRGCERGAGRSLEASPREQRAGAQRASRARPSDSASREASDFFFQQKNEIDLVYHGGQQCCEEGLRRDPGDPGVRAGRGGSVSGR